MKVQIFSDLHLEHYDNVELLWNKVKPEAPIALIVGDFDAEHFETSMCMVSKKFEKIVCVLGNHDFYHKNINWKPVVPDNVSVLNPGIVEHDGVVFIGATLWTDFKNEDWFVMHNAQKNISDFSFIENFAAHNAFEKHRKERAFIKFAIEENRGKKIVIMTHFLPSWKLISESRRSENLLNYYFSASCEDLIACSEASLWVFGHTHDRIDTSLYDVHFVCNPLGYYSQLKLSQYQHTVIEI